MTIGIYSIKHKNSNKRYIGKSIKIEHRWWSHKNDFKKETRPADCNRHLYNAVRKHGIEEFEFSILELFSIVDEEQMSERELYWIDFYNSCNRANGYNLRRDSSTKMIVHEETKKLRSKNITGKNNPNYGKKWSEEQKQRMSEIKRGTKLSEETKQKISKNLKEMWKDENKKKQMAKNVAYAVRKYNFIQYDLKGNEIKRYKSVKEICNLNPGFKWQNIYSVCNGYKPTYMGFYWKKVSRND